MEYRLQTITEKYAVGDTVIIVLGFPKATKVEVWIEK